jgi:hypothetical protein
VVPLSELQYRNLWRFLQTGRYIPFETLCRYGSCLLVLGFINYTDSLF